MEIPLTSQRASIGAGVIRHVLSLLLAGLLLPLMGCDRSAPTTDTNAENEVNYLRAKKLYDQQDFPAAAEFYKKTLSVNPDFARAHLELGLLYGDKLDDPIGAIYHYRRYLELRPDSEKRQLVEDFIERAKLSLAAKLPSVPTADPGEIARLQNDKAALLQENAGLRSRIADLEKATPAVAASSSSEATPSAVPPPPAVSTPVVMASPPVAMLTEPAAPHTYVVQKGDTLQSLALRYYGTRSAWERIYQANRSGLPSKDQLKVGQQLVIP